VKIPRWLRQYLGADIEIDVYSGRDYPDNLAEYSLVVHCGSCKLNRRETLERLQMAERAGVPVTNYGMCIAYVQGVLERVLTPFPAALDAFKHAR
jgi:predicted GTPase